MAKSKRVTTKGNAKRVAPRALSANDAAVTVPTVDSRGKPMPDWRIARWHLVCAANLLRGAYGRTRGQGQALDFERAASVAMQLWASIEEGGEPNADALDRERLMRMARHSRWGLRTARSDAEAALLERLPKTADEATGSGEWRALGPQEGARNLAVAALSCLAAQPHADALKLLKRWGLAETGFNLGPSNFWDDVDELASAIHELVDTDAPDRDSFGRLLVKRMYRQLGLGIAFEALKKSRQRKRE